MEFATETREGKRAKNYAPREIDVHAKKKVNIYLITAIS